MRKEARRLKAQGVDILIALGHAGIKVDIKIAKLIPEIDVVIGGHTNTFLHNGMCLCVNIYLGVLRVLSRILLGVGVTLLEKAQCVLLG